MKVQLTAKGFIMANAKVGLSTLYCLGQPFQKMVKNIVEAETSYIELVDDGLHALDKRRTFTLKDVGESYGIKYSVHAPFADINIASPSKSILEAIIKRLEKSIANASVLGAYVWVFHPGLKTGISMFYPGMDWKQNLKTACKLFKIAADYGVKIAIENVPEPYPFLMKNVKSFENFYAEIDADISIAFDVGHANLNGQIEFFLKAFANKIVHMHVHDNNGREDQHLGIGFGTIDWKNFAKLLREIAYDKVLVVECIEHVNESLNKLKRLLAGS
ncbi:MAG: sugar phosphate isomerase/epimerase [Candidatus Bathyarchaeia archaeon]